MGLPVEPVTLSQGQIQELAERLSLLRHNVNNHLSLIVAALELIRRKPELAPRFLDNLAQQPDKIIEEMRAYSEHLEKTCGITRP